MEREIEIQKQVQLALSAHGFVSFRNNTGMGWQGEFVSRNKNLLILRNPRPLHAGLCEGSPDLVGWQTVIIQPEMVGKPIAVMGGLEIKRPGGRGATDAQINFLSQLHNAGGIAAVVKSPQEALGGIKDWFERIRSS